MLQDPNHQVAQRWASELDEKYQIIARKEQLVSTTRGKLG